LRSGFHAQPAGCPGSFNPFLGILSLKGLSHATPFTAGKHNLNKAQPMAEIAILAFFRFLLLPR
jgi:hypothetical protein